MKLVSMGLGMAGSGLRQRDPLRAGAGLALALVGGFLRARKPKRELVVKRRLRPGRTLVVRVAGPDDQLPTLT